MPPGWRSSQWRARRRRWPFGINPFVSALLGMLTGIGGGVLRDLLVNEIPVVLRADLYAVAALAGAAVVVAGHLVQWPPTATTIGGSDLCFAIRLVAIRRGWSLPAARPAGSLVTTEPPMTSRWECVSLPAHDDAGTGRACGVPD